MPAHTRVSTSFAGTEKLSAAFENSTENDNDKKNEHSAQHT